MHTDSYPDSIHKKIQTDNPTLSMYSVRLKLPHIPSIRLNRWPQNDTPGRPAGSWGRSLYLSGQALLFSLSHSSGFVAHPSVLNETKSQWSIVFKYRQAI